MNNRFMISVAAAALIAATAAANAQGTGMGHEGQSGGAVQQQGAPSSGSASTPTGRESAEPGRPSSGMRATQSETRSPSGSTNQRSEDNMPSPKSKGASSETDTGKAMKAEGREDRNGMKAEGREDRNGMKAESREDRNGMKAESREDRNGMKAESREDRNGTRTEGRQGETTGQAGAGAKISTEQRTRITSVIREQHVRPLDRVDFAVTVGTRVPRDVEFHPLPSDIVSIYPDWRGYEFVMVRDRILVIDPDTLEIVAIIEA